MIVYKTRVDTIPTSCGNCPLYWCVIPTNKDGSALLKRYVTRKHPDCPLIEIKEAQHEETLHQTDHHAAPRD
ncbi:MAG: hypothetical protein IJW78_04900 [Clostridia bacterium]|nr:hypothetical protein [Clostridia bacterium]